MSDGVVEAIDLVVRDDGAEAAAEQAAHALGVESAIETLSGAANGAFGRRHDRLLAVLGELRKRKEVEA